MDEEAVYTPHQEDPKALRVPCPVCPAPVGTWCGGKGDIHEERHGHRPDPTAVSTVRVDEPAADRRRGPFGWFR